MMIDNNLLVCVQCITYNHAPYIQDTMNGFCTQDTTFPYVCVIIDDASTDGEPVVIQQYLYKNFDSEGNGHFIKEETDDYLLIFAQHKTSKNCYFAVFLLKYNHYQTKKARAPYYARFVDQAKYLAICEGDDYWIDPQKLQKQVDFLETHSDYGMCYSNYKDYNEMSKCFMPSSSCAYHGIRELIQKNPIATLTTLFRADLNNKYLKEIVPGCRGWKMGDYPRWLWFELESKIHYFDEVMAVYRTLPESKSHSRDYKRRLSFIESTRDIKIFFAQKYSLGDNITILINDAYWRERSTILKGKDKQAYKEALRNIHNKSIKERIKVVFSFC